MCVGSSGAFRDTKTPRGETDFRAFVAKLSRLFVRLLFTFVQRAPCAGGDLYLDLSPDWTLAQLMMYEGNLNQLEYHQKGNCCDSLNPIFITDSSIQVKEQLRTS